MNDRLPRRRVLLGVCGSSSATGVHGLVELLREHIAPQVIVVATPAAVPFLTGFPGPVTGDADWHSGQSPLHVELARSADEFIVCPATANTLAKAALGLADTLLTACILAYPAPVWFAPATNRAMWSNPVVQQHVAVLAARQHRVLEPAPNPSLTDGVNRQGGGNPAGVACAWPDVVAALLRHYIDDLDEKGHPE
ncbi:phosphopantothenoylcysteine decarboxylase / phosphopantothenate--cysteine ligase [Sinosporangium album]|uniref:Phosphopantothenoylcysteine decarboxylase / phosphopantothenate--cysteine ligase n=1 Tax=Sinosporangium album TaxID=504805 RepID=A0A1G7ZLQ8_9ACTN|nr:flavoprotein [Sinosporangium album]SDH09496.1 phosphopantothenoylcysteine decarboxylase / phosphopantothenate--cysteine ligase [Sinosporangium album]